MNAFSPDENVSRVWKLAKSIRVGMLVTTSEAGMHGRPLQALFEEESGLIWFITNRNSAKVSEVEAHAQALLTFSDAKGEHVVMKGKVAVDDDRAKLKALWTTAADVFFPKGASDPEATLIRFDPEFAEFWSGGSGVMAFAVHLVEAKLTGKTPAVGEHAKVTL